MRAIVATDQAYGIGKDGQLQHHVSSDLKRFKQITSGGVVIYGRKTLATFPAKKALPGRINIMLTRNPDLKVPNVQNASSLDDLFAILDKLRKKGYQEDRIFVIGGADIYDQLLAYTNEILLTRFNGEFDADRYFPNLDNDGRFAMLDAGEWQTEGNVTFRYERWRQVASEIRLKQAVKRDRRMLARLNPADVLSGTIKVRHEKLERFCADGERVIYMLKEKEDEIGAILFSPDVIGADAAMAVLHCNRSLTALALSTLLTTLFDDHPGLYSLVLSADRRVPIDVDSLSSVRTLALPGIRSNRLLIVATRPDYCRYSVGFYPFPLGLVGMESDGTGLTRVTFLQQARPVKDSRFAMALKAHGFLDQNDKLCRRSKSPFTSSSQPDVVLKTAFDWLDAYFAGKTLPDMPSLVAPQQTEFMSKVMEALRAIPLGEYLTYGELAATIFDQEKALHYARAVGQACAANPHALFVPCHRVIGSKGELVGFSGGIRVKDYLLNHELMMRLGKSVNKG